MYGFYRAFPISSRFLAKIANVTHLSIHLRTCVVPKNRTVLAAIVELSGWISKGYFGQRWSQARSGLHKKT